MVGEKWQVALTGENWQVKSDRWKAIGEKRQVTVICEKWCDRWTVAACKWKVTGDCLQVKSDKWQVALTGELLLLTGENLQVKVTSERTGKMVWMLWYYQAYVKPGSIQLQASNGIAPNVVWEDPGKGKENKCWCVLSLPKIHLMWHTIFTSKPCSSIISALKTDCWRSWKNSSKHKMGGSKYQS